MDWRLDRTRRVVVIGDETIPLTEQQTELLAYFLDHRGEVVERRTLEREIWRMPYTVHSEAVPVAVRTLRRRLGSPGASITTVRGRGWRLTGPARRSAVETPTDTALFTDPVAFVSTTTLDTLLADSAHHDDALWWAYFHTHLAGPVDRWIRHLATASSDRPFVPLVRAACGGRDPATTGTWDAATPEARWRARVLWATSWRPRTMAGWAPLPVPADELAALCTRYANLPSAPAPDAFALTEGLLAEAGRFRLLQWLVQAHLADLRLRAHHVGRALAIWDALSDVAPPELPFFRARVWSARADALCIALGRAGLVQLDDVVELLCAIGLQDTWGLGRLGVWCCILGEPDRALPFLQGGARDSDRSAGSLCAMLQTAIETGDHPNVVDRTLFVGHVSDGTPLWAVATIALRGLGYTPTVPRELAALDTPWMRRSRMDHR